VGEKREALALVKSADPVGPSPSVAVSALAVTSCSAVAGPKLMVRLPVRELLLARPTSQICFSQPT
jgi:hypothetical protein